MRRAPWRDRVWAGPVEGGEPPERIVASRPLDGDAVRTRPLCPYPQVARYRGQASTDDASNFACMPEPTRR